MRTQRLKPRLRGASPARGLAPRTALLLAAAFGSWSGCRSCVHRFELDPVEADVRRLEEQRARLAPERRELAERIQEFRDKVYVNQHAALDLLKLDLTERTRRFVARLRKIRVRTRPVRRVWRRELEAYEELAEAFSILQQAFQDEDNDRIRRGLALYERGLKDLESSRLALQRLRRKFSRRP